MTRLTLKYKFFLLVLYTLAYTFFYIYPNLWPLSEPRFLPMLPIDHYFTLQPWAFVVYISDYLLFTLAIIILDDPAEFNSYARMSFFGLFICGLFFLFFPTTYPRPVYPEVSNPISWAAMNLVGVADTPNNCFPSMHVTMTAVATYALRNRGMKIFLPYVIWAISIFVSTLLTKQHYFVDIVGGLAVTFITAVSEKWIGQWLAGRKISYKWWPS